VPPLGCGNGGLNWSDVLPLIRRSLVDCRREVLVYPPHGAPSAGEIVHRRSVRDESEPGDRHQDLAAVFALGYQLTLLECTSCSISCRRRGSRCASVLPRRLTVRMPTTCVMYCTGLRAISRLGLRMAGTSPTPRSSCSRRRGKRPTVHFGPRGKQQAELGTVGSRGAVVEGSNRLRDELLATVHWVAVHDRALSLEDTVAGVHAWNPRKKKLMAPRAHRRGVQPPRCALAGSDRRSLIV